MNTNPEEERKTSAISLQVTCFFLSYNVYGTFTQPRFEEPISCQFVNAQQRRHTLQSHSVIHKCTTQVADLYEYLQCKLTPVHIIQAEMHVKCTVSLFWMFRDKHCGAFGLLPVLIVWLHVNCSLQYFKSIVRAFSDSERHSHRFAERIKKECTLQAIYRIWKSHLISHYLINSAAYNALPESGYKHKSLISVDGSMDVNGFPCQTNKKGCEHH